MGGGEGAVGEKEWRLCCTRLELGERAGEERASWNRSADRVERGPARYQYPLEASSLVPVAVTCASATGGESHDRWRGEGRRGQQGSGEVGMGGGGWGGGGDAANCGRGVRRASGGGVSAGGDRA